MTAVFAWKPAYGPQVQEAPRTLVAQFGDGYQQRSGEGVRSILQAWMLTFNVSGAVADAILAFFRAQGGYTPFYWQPPEQTAYMLVICSTWQETVTPSDTRTVNATFQQVSTVLDEIWDDGLTIWDAA